MTTDAVSGRVSSCADARCNYREPHDHGLACGHECTVCAGREATDVPRKMLPARCICSDHSCYCRDYARGWNDALDAVAALTPPARKATPDA